MDDAIKQLTAQLRERAASPLAATFVLSWMLWNYRFLVILFSDAGVSQTFLLIDTNHFVTPWDVALKGFIYPALTTATYIFIYPVPAKFVFEFWAKKQKELRELRQKVEGQTPLTLEESRAIRGERYKMEAEYQEQLQRKDDEIQRLKAERAPNEPKRTKAPKEQVASETVLPQEQELLLRKIGSASEITEAKLLPQASGETRVAAEYNLGELLRKELAARKWKDAIGAYSYSLTHNGKEYIVKHPAKAHA